MAENNDSDNKNPDTRKDSLPERITFWISCLLVLFVFGFLGFHAFTSNRPDNALKPDAVVSANKDKATTISEGRWLVPITVKNVGEIAIEELQVRINWKGSDGQKEEGDLTFDYVAEGATKDAYLVVETDPAKLPIEAHITLIKTQRKARGY